jgi:TM2 domain-containing membrane protein YozV
MKDKTTAALLAFFLGGLGGHKFYLGQTGAGVVYLLFCWTFIPAVIAFVEFVLLLTMDPSEFDRRFNHGPAYGYPQVPIQQNVVIHTGPAPYPQPGQHVVTAYPGPPNQLQGGASGSGSSVADEIKKLNELRVAGVITEQEFVAHKQKLLS